ncbi:MAG: hypothetical protein IJX67_03875, partial [Oscillospiraceae bacterium]|nr:hypothetical protein [Oscillospiraceae bacterium]
PEGQAYDVSITTEISGWKEIAFTLPRMIGGKQNFRWDYIRSGYLVRCEKDGMPDWYLLSAPKRTHKGLNVNVTITCQHICAQ